MSVKNITDKIFTNPLSDVVAADPYVKYTDGYFYATYTECDRITLFRSRSFDTVVKDEKKVIFRAGDDIKANIWAPEFHYIPSLKKWFVYACGLPAEDTLGSMRMFCLESEGEDLFRDYYFAGLTSESAVAIDQTVFFDDASGSLYTAFSEFTEDGQVITFAAMDGPAKVSDRRLRLSKPEFEWETRGPVPDKDSRVNEGPIFLLQGGKLSLIYSASGCWSRWYCLGLIEYTGEDFTEKNMLNPTNWIKHKEPIFKEGNDVYGVGHCSFFTSPDGETTWIAYHGMATPDAGEEGRYMYAQPISFDENNLPVIGEPVERGRRYFAPN